MADNLTKEQRSLNMSRIRSKWTKQEVAVHKSLSRNKIKHNMHPKILGSPDLILKSQKVAVFIHGCFWHRCSKCFKKPKTNRKYWLPKIKKNTERDRRNAKLLKSFGFRIITVWEHEIKKDPGILLKMIKK